MIYIGGASPATMDRTPLVIIKILIIYFSNDTLQCVKIQIKMRVGAQSKGGVDLSEYN